MSTAFDIRPLAPFGMEVTNIDLGKELDDSKFSALKSAFERHSLMIVRDQQNLSPEAQIRFSRLFGPLEIHVQRRFLLDGHPEILIVSTELRDGEPIGLADAGRYWHSDLSYMPEPSLASLLLSRKLPTDGGDTLFADQHAAYDDLPKQLAARLELLQAEHSYLARNAAQRAQSALRPDLSEAQKRSVPPSIHPVVRVHPATGRKALFVSEGFTTRIVDLPEDESADLLATLFHHQTQAKFIHRHRWRAGDLVMWDNRALLHLAAGGPPGMVRTMHRTTIRGDRVIGPA